MDHQSKPKKETNSQQKSGLLNFIAETTESALNTGKAVVDTAVDLGQAAVKQTYRLIGQATHGTGEAVTYVGNLPFVKQAAGVLRLDWLVGVSDRIDLAKAEAQVKELQEKYPNEYPSEIAHRIMVEKAIHQTVDKSGQRLQTLER